MKKQQNDLTLSALLSWDNITRTFNKHILHNDRSPLQQQLFMIHARHTSIRSIQGFFLALMATIIANWPKDFFVYANKPYLLYAHMVIRTLSIIFGIGIFFAIEKIDFIEKNINISFTIMGCIISAVIGVTFGLRGGVKLPWYYLVYIVPWVTIVQSVEILPRFISTLLMSVAFHIGFFAPFPGNLEYEFLNTSFSNAFACVFLSTAVGHIVHHLNRENFFSQRELNVQQQKVERMARHDELTGLYNRRHFDEKLTEEYDRAERYDNNISFCMIDIDHFKDVNDTFGHPAGDRVLEQMGQLIREYTRSTDIGGRYGGEEFAVIFPQTSIEDAEAIAQRLHSELANETFHADNGDEFSVTCSIGISSLDDSVSSDEELVKKADETLYEAKEGGRNQIIRAS